MEKTFLQVHTDTKDKEQTSVTLEELGTNSSSVINMLLKQIILTKSAPFEVKVPHLYTSEEQISEVSASLAMEQMPPDREDTKMLEKYQQTGDKEAVRQQILKSYKESRMSDKICCYPNSSVLINRLNIHDTDKLLEVERRLTMLHLMDLLEKPISDKFDLEHLRSVHKYIFQDIYPWAGKVRIVDIAKSNMFCKVQFIEIRTKEIFDKLQKNSYLKQLSKEKFAKGAACYFSGISALHPFRGGNGRAQRELIRQLAYESGYILCFAAIVETEMVETGIDFFVCDYKKMEALFTEIIEVR